MSWIIRSRITSTSVPRGVNGASRCDSMNRGSPSTSSSAISAALKRSRWPTWRTAPPPRGELDQHVGFIERRGDRLLDQDMQAGFEQAARDREVLPGRHDHARRLDPPGQRAEIAQRQGAQPRAERPRPLELAVDHRDQLRIGQRGVFLGVMTAEMTAADHGRPDRPHQQAGRQQASAVIVLETSTTRGSRPAASCAEIGFARGFEPHGVPYTRDTSRRRGGPKDVFGNPPSARLRFGLVPLF